MAIRSYLLASKVIACHWQSMAFAHELAKHQNWSAQKLASLNTRRLQDIITHAYLNIPFYKKKYSEAGFQLEDLKGQNAHQRLPVLERDEVIEHADLIFNPKYSRKRLAASSTGGTTGSPVTTYHDPRIHLPIISWRTLGWWGVGIGDSSGYLYRNVPTEREARLQKSLLWPTRREWISAASMTQHNLMAFHSALYKIRPRYLVGYVGALEVFANFMIHNGLQLPTLKAIWTTSSPLTSPTRNRLEKAFNAPAYTQYGSCEFYWIAAECSRKCGLHIANDIRNVEILVNSNPLPSGEIGDIVVTDLINKAFPLIRYRTGDQGRLLPISECTCGLPFPLMDYVHGRTSDTITTISGTKVPGEYWTTICDDHTDIVQAFSVRQFKNRHVEIIIQALPKKPHEIAVRRITETLLAKFGSDLSFSIKEGEVNTNNSGKARFVVSEAD